MKKLLLFYWIVKFGKSVFGKMMILSDVSRFSKGSNIIQFFTGLSMGKTLLLLLAFLGTLRANRLIGRICQKNVLFAKLRIIEIFIFYFIFSLGK